MDTEKLLEQILKSGQQMLDRGQEIAEDKLKIPEQGTERDAMFSGLGKGAMMAGGLAVLLGTGAGRRLTGGTLKLGGLAANWWVSLSDLSKVAAREHRTDYTFFW